MKNVISRRWEIQLVVTVLLGALLVVLASPARAALADLGQLSLGPASAFSAFAMGGTSTDQLRTSNPQTTIYGNGAVGPYAVGSGDAHFTGYVAVDPSANVSGNSWVVNGGFINQSLAAAAAAVVSASTYAAGLIPDYTFGALGGAQTIARAGDITVVNIGSINFTGAGDVLTLQGGANDFFVINVSDRITLTHGGVAIGLSGGLPANHVLFNLTTTQSGINALNTSGNAEVFGTFIAPYASINLASGTVNGAVMAGVDLVMVSGSTINGAPFVPEPSTFFAAALLLLPFAASTIRALRKTR